MNNAQNTQQVKATIITGYGMWQHPIAVKNALCADGKRRSVRLNQDGQTGRCTIGKKTLRGFMAYNEETSCVESGELDYKFVAYSNQDKNAE